MALTDSEIREHLKAILAQDAFRTDDSSEWGDLWQRLRNALGWVFDHFGSSIVTFVLVICAILVAVVATLLWRMHESRTPSSKARRARRPHQTVAEQNAPEALLERARNLAASGHVREAARALQQAVLVNLCLQKQVPWQPTLADWEWLMVLRPDAPVVAFTQRAQRLAYGSDATAQLYEMCERDAVALLNTHGRSL